MTPTLNRTTRAWIIVLLTSVFGACATVPGMQPMPPEVQIADIDIIKLGLSSQELAFTLDVFNPNSFALPVNTLEFTASTQDTAQTVASGRTEQSVVLFANRTTQVLVNVNARTNRLLRQLIAASLSDAATVDYTVTGFVKLDNWPARIPFDVDKSFSLDDS